MKQITNIRKAVCTMANELKKEGYTLSQAFRKAWRRIKLSMKIRAVGTTAGNIQERLGFMKQFPVDTMQAELVREPENPFDKKRHQDCGPFTFYQSQNCYWLCSGRTCSWFGSSH